MFSPLRSIWNVGNCKCYICFSVYENGENWQSADYRKRVIESCSETLYPEIKGDEFNYNLFRCKDYFPFCPNCWKPMENIYVLNQKKEKAEILVQDVVKDLAMKVLSNRQCLKKKGIFSTSKSNPIKSTFLGVKLEGSLVYQNIKCKLCHNMYKIGEFSDSFSLDISGKVMECCDKHLFPELIDEDFFDWNSIPYNNSIPFCEDCLQPIKKIMVLDEELKFACTQVANNLDKFTLDVLRRRRSSGHLGLQNENGFSENGNTADFIDCKENIDNDDECQIIGINNTKVFPNNFAETVLQEPTAQVMEQQLLIESPSTVLEVDSTNLESSTNLGYSFQQNDEAMTNSTEGELQDSSSQAINEGQSNQQSSSIPSTMSINSILENVQNNNVQPTSFAILSMQQAKIFQCQKCGKAFIFRKSWETHVAVCSKSVNTTEVKICCGQSFTDEGSWNIHRASHTSQSFINSTVSTSSNLNSQTQKLNLEIRCNYCDKRLKTKRGLTLHIRSHTQLDTYKCPQCTKAYGYVNQLKKHYREDHPKCSISHPIIPTPPGNQHQ